MQPKLQLKAILLIFFLLILITACNQEEQEEATATAEADQSTVQYVPFVDDELGLTLQHPANWVTQSAFGGATIATSQSIIDAESLAEIGEEAFVVVIPGEIDQFNFQTGQSFTEDDVLSALATYKVLLEREGQEYVTVQPPEAFTNDRQKMARMVLRSTEDGEPLITVMAVVMEDGYMALISAASQEETADEMRSIFNRIIESIHVGPPAGIS